MRSNDVSHHHTWRLAYNLALGIPDAEGWVPKVLVRACRECQYAESLHGAEHLASQRNRLTSWEAWGPQGVLARSDTLRWKQR